MSVELKKPEFEGMALFSQGFRPFFLFGSVYTALTVLFWVPAFEGRQELLTAFVPVDWHIHEMLFGFLPAVITGFLLTAVPSWTNRPPVVGRSLILLFVLWVFGRLAIMLSAVIGFYTTLIIDCSFLLALIMVAGREIAAAQNWRNLKVLVPLLILLIANILFHYETNLEGHADYSRRLGLGTAIFLIMLISGRIIPSFTRNWLAKRVPGRMPIQFNRSDLSIVVLSIIALVLWIFRPTDTITGICMIFVGGLNVFRIARWAGDRVFKNALMLFHHIAFLFIPLGFLMIGASIVGPGIFSQAAGIHAFGAGAIGAMTLSVMIRATLGHTNQPLIAGAGEKAIFTAVVISSLFRVVGSLGFAASANFIHLSGLIWIGAFLGFALLHMSTMFTSPTKGT